MIKEIPNIYADGRCFFCGDNNPIGLKLKFYIDEAAEEVSTEYLPSPFFKGLGSILHGGIQSGLFDEIMGWTAHNITGEMGVTTDLHVTFSKPLYVENPIKVSCRITSREGRKVHMRATITHDGIVCSSATGTYYLLPPERFQEITRGNRAG